MDNGAKDTIVIETRSSEEREHRGQPRRKRARVSLACERCRARKQKCDGARNSCSTCTRLGLNCHYKAHLTPKPDQKRLYITALEDRVAVLENYLSSLGHQNVGEDHWTEKTQEVHEEIPPIGDNDSVIDAEGDVISPASTHDESHESPGSLGRVLGSVVKTQMRAAKQDVTREVREDDNPRSVARSELVQKMGPMFMTSGMARRLLDGWIKHLSTRYPIIHTPRLRELHARRDEALDPFEESILHLIYANSGRILEATGETGMFFTDQHYDAALLHMDAILELRDTRSVAYLLLMALYCLRGPRDPGAWTLAGLAVRLCIELGLHRKSPHSQVSIERELNKRTFWSCYYLDRELSVALGRPPAISDNDMDVELPLDVDEDVDDVEILKRASKRPSDLPASPPSSLTTFIHFMRLRRIESKIEHVIYRVDRQTQTTPAIIQGFLDQLTAWKRAIPSEYHSQHDSKHEAYNGIDIFMIFYHKCVRLLLYPLLAKPNLNLQYLKLCAEACAGVCEAYKRLHRTLKADYSPLSLQSMFLAGLTLIYCTWLAPRNYLDVMGAVSDCNIMLYVMAERWPAARKYRDVFERIKTNVTDVIAQGDHQATRAAGILDAEMTERCRALDQALPGAVRTDYLQMISAMAKDRGRNKSDMRSGQTSGYPRGQNSLQELGHPSQVPPSQGTTVEFSNLHTQGNIMDSAFICSLEDFGGLTADWDIAMFEGTSSISF